MASGSGWLLGLLGLGGAAAIVAIAVASRRSSSGDDSPAVDFSSAGLGPPLRPPLRRTTPHGGFHAPRYVGGVLDHLHQGLDLAGRPGEPVLAVADGRIVAIDNPGNCKLGRKLQLDDGRQVVYCDLGTATVQPGDRVRRGDAVGTVNREGFVHVAMRGMAPMHAWIDPRPIIPHQQDVHA